jgi:hypothetical protein
MLPEDAPQGAESCWDAVTGLERHCVRTLEIIPRQSALNVNDFHATTKNTGILGLFQLISGFGAKTSYQRQKEVYEKFLQQEVFASGFGKGERRFGWTFGPQPGSRRIAPGQRTTYAVLAVPKNALALEIEARAWVFPRRSSPGLGRETGYQKFLVRIPGERTERLWVDSISYVPVDSGRNVTAIITGIHFSPQLGALVNGVPLKRVRSITRTAGDETPRANASSSGVEGEFEIPNMQEMVLSFAMPANYVGTPIITLVTPERSTPINFFHLTINNRPEPRSLQEASLVEPMFMEPYDLQTQLEEVKLACKPKRDKGFVLYRLNGRGLRGKADISVRDQFLDTITVDAIRRRYCRGRSKAAAAQERTRSYLLYFHKPSKGEAWKVRYRHRTRQSFEETSFEHKLPAEAGFKQELRNYRFDPNSQAAEIALSFSIPGIEGLPGITLEDPLPRPGSQEGCGQVEQDDTSKTFRVRCRVGADHDGGETDFMSLKIVETVASEKGKPPEQRVRFVDIKLPVQVRVQSIAGFDTDAPEGPSGEESTVFLHGANLNRVRGVLFGDRAAKLERTTPDVLEVRAPKVDVPAGEVLPVLVTIQVDDGAVATGFHYTYIGPEPKPAAKVKEKTKELEKYGSDGES